MVFKWCLAAALAGFLVQGWWRITVPDSALVRHQPTFPEPDQSTEHASMRECSVRAIIRKVIGIHDKM